MNLDGKKIPSFLHAYGVDTWMFVQDPGNNIDLQGEIVWSRGSCSLYWELFWLTNETQESSNTVVTLG